MLTKTKLTRSSISKLAPAANDLWAWDLHVTGFAVRVRPSGKKTFYVKTREGKRQVAFALGDAEQTDVDSARERAREIVQTAKLKRPLSEIIHRPSRGFTIADLAEQHQAVHKVKASTKATYKIYWNAHIKMQLGSKQLTELTRLDVERFHVAVGKESPVSANRCVKLLSKAINDMNLWGNGWPQIANQAHGIKMFPEQKIERILTAPEARRLFDELNRRISIDETNSIAWLIIVLMSTGLRHAEWRLARWDQLSLNQKTLALPSPKNGKPRIVNLDDDVVGLLSRMPRRGKWLFPREDLKAPIGKPRGQWVTIKKACQLDARFRLHDLRHTFASVALVDAKLSIKEVAELLGHANVATTARYIHLLDDQARNARAQAAAALSARFS
jgi:integrase